MLVVPLLEEVSKATWARDLLPTRGPPPQAPHLYFRQRIYISQIDSVSDWRPFPLSAPDEVISRSPPTLLFVAKYDVLKGAAIRYFERLTKAGVESSMKEYDGPHDVLRRELLLPAGGILRQDLLVAFKAAFDT